VASPCTSARTDINFWSNNGWLTDSIIRREHGYGIATLCDPSRCCRESLVAPNLRIEEDSFFSFLSLSLSIYLSIYLSICLYLSIYLSISISLPQFILTQNASPFRSNARALETKGDRSSSTDIIYLLCNRK